MIWENLEKLLKIVGKTPWDSIVIHKTDVNLTVAFQYLWCTHLNLELSVEQADDVFTELIQNRPCTNPQKWDIEWKTAKVYQLRGSIIFEEENSWKIAFHRLNFDFKGKVCSLVHLQDTANTTQLLFNPI